MGNPLRLRVLHLLEDGELTVTELLKQTSTSQANLSKHLSVLRAGGLVNHRRDGVNVYYSISDPIVLVVCRTMCDSILRQADEGAKAIRAVE